MFTSANGVQAFLGRLRATGRDVRALGRVQLAAIGPGTADALRGFTSFLRDAMLLRAGVLSPMPAERKSALEAWSGQVPPDHIRASLAAAQRTQLLIDQNVNPRLAMEVMLLDLRVHRPQ